MGLWRRLGAFLAAPFRASSEPAPRPIDQVILDMTGRLTGGRVSRAQALTVPAVQRGRNMLASLSTLPVVQLGPDNRPVRGTLFEQIDEQVANVVTLAQTIDDLLFESVSWWRITQFGSDGFPMHAQHLDVGTVSVNPPNGRNAPLPSGFDPRGGVVWVDGKPVSGAEIIRFDSPNPALLVVGAKVIRRAILLDAAASLYADDPRPLDFFTPTDGAEEISDDDVEAIIEKWRAARRKRSTAWVPRAMTYNSVDAPSPQQLQLVELQKQASLDLANALGIDPEDLGISTTSRTYTNAIDRRRDRINDVLSPYMRAITDRLSMNDVTRRGRRVIFDLDDYMKANPTERWNTYKIAREIHAVTIEEIRAEENLPPAPPALIEESKAKPAPAPAAPPLDPNTPVPNDASSLADFRLNANAVAGVERRQFALPIATFSVDATRRTIEGLALPYGHVGSKYGMKFAFMEGSLKWASVNRVKLLRDHDPSQALGIAMSLVSKKDGLYIKAKVARGAAGDEALALAEDGVLDGLSVGVDFDMMADTVMADDGETFVIKRADLREVSLTPMPLFDDARLSKVVATSQEGNAMKCTTCGQVHAEGVTTCTAPVAPTQPAGLQLSNDQWTTLLGTPGVLQSLVAPAQPQAPQQTVGSLTLSKDQIEILAKSGALATLFGLPAGAAGGAPETREIVNAGARPTAQTTVREALPYRFDRGGNLTRGATYDFSTDLFAAQKGDMEAKGRAEQWLVAMGDRFTIGGNQQRVEADTDMADTATLNPSRQRPDLYVDQKDYQYPIWSAIESGTLADITPFILPKFSSATGQVAAHVEGVEPTVGTYVATSQTITPTAVSGKMEITREAWDQGGNPQLSGIIWRQMTKAWFEALEAAAVAVLDAASPTQITLTTAAADDALVGELEAALALLQFVRGGLSMRDLFLQVDLYKKLTAAVDGDGRKLLPLLGAVNAAGTVSEFYSDVTIGGLRGRPAWALAATGVVAASSYLFDRDNVHGWASAPNRLDFDYQVKSLFIGIWGYKATAITDDTGVREIVYDPQ